MAAKLDLKFTQNILLLLTILVTLVVSPFVSYDPFNLPKLGVLCTGATILLTVIIKKSTLILLWKSTFVKINVIFILILTLSTLASNSDLISELIGRSGRNNGALSFAAFSIISVTSYWISNKIVVQKFLKVFFFLGTILAVYGYLQYFGLEFLPYLNMNASNVIGTFGNSNFMSAFLSFVSVALISVLLSNHISQSYSKIIYLVLLLLGCVILIVLSDSYLGLFVIFITFIFIVDLKLLNSRGPWNLIIFGNFMLLTLFMILMKYTELWNNLLSNLYDRIYYWYSGIRMVLNHPLFGVGIDSYGDWYRMYRSRAAFESYLKNNEVIANSAHNLLLDLGSGGGLLLLSSYLALQIYVLHLLVSRNDLDAISKNYLNQLGALWFAFNVQSFVNVNQIGISIWGWTTSGLIAGLFRRNAIQNYNQESFSRSKNKKLGQISMFAHPIGTRAIIGLTCGVLICLPPIFADIKFASALKARNAKLLLDAATRFPLDPIRLNIAAQIFYDNKLIDPAHEVLEISSKHFPRNYEALLLYRLIETNRIKRQKIERRMEKLDPFNTTFK